MRELQQIEHDILANGRVDDNDLRVMRQHLYAGGKVNRREADFLVELHKRVQRPTPAFERLFYQAIKDHILGHAPIDGEAADWLRRMLFTDGKIRDEERSFLHELHGEAGPVCREFEMLFEESMKEPQEQHTCG